MLWLLSDPEHSLKRDLAELQAKKSALSAEKASKVRHLDALLEKVRDLEVKSVPVVREFALGAAPEHFRKFEGTAARLLPKPLYNLLFILVGWIAANEEAHLTLSIVGSEAEAQKGSLKSTWRMVCC